MLERLKAKTRVTGTFGRLYVRRHNRLVSSQIGDREKLDAFGEGGRLEEGYGRGLDERVVEYPWAFSRLPEGAILDAGSTFNFAHVLDAALPRVDSLTIVTLAPEPRAFPERGVEYVYGDLGDLPFEDSSFDCCVSISTLEHVGMDNTIYGDDGDAAADPDAHLAQALAEIRRVLKPGARLLITVPYGRPENHGWWRQFDAGMVGRLIATAGPASERTTVYRYTAQGWQVSSLEEAGDESYYDIRAADGPPDDGAAAARAVACLDLVLP